MAVSQLGESLNNILDGLEEIGFEDIPPELEYDLRKAMNLPPATHMSSPSPLSVSSFFQLPLDDDNSETCFPPSSSSPFALSPMSDSESVMASLFLQPPSSPTSNSSPNLQQNQFDQLALVSNLFRGCEEDFESEDSETLKSLIAKIS